MSSRRQTPIPDTPDDGSTSPIRTPALLVGMLLSFLVAVGLPYGEFLVKGTRFGVSSSTPGAFFVLFLLLILVQPLLGWMRRSWMFNRPELLLMAVGMMLVSAVATRGFTGVFMGVIAAPFYYATTENQWAQKLFTHIPDWIVPQDLQAVEWFFEGLPPGQSIPWSVWLVPLGWWFVLMGAFYTVLVCLMVILRRQWMDNERLLYPLVQVPLGMTADGEHASRLKPFLKNPVMWLGFAFPFLIHTFNVISRYSEGIASFTLVSGVLPLFRNTVSLSIKINFLVLGLSYLINTGVAFSLWFFFVLAKVQWAICSILGIYSTVQLDSASYRGSIASIMSHQTMGAMMVLVLLGFWVARSHLREVWRQAWRGSAKSAAQELISYRAAVIGLVAGLGTMAVWLWRSGLPPWAAAMFLFGAFVVYLALTRVIVEAGLVTALQGLNGAGFTLSCVGSSNLGVGGMLGLGFTMPWAGDHMVFMMAPVANSIRMMHGMRRSRRRIIWFIGAVMGIGLIGSVGTTLVLGYRHGAVNLTHQYFNWFAQEPFRVAALLLDKPSAPYWPGWLWTATGGLFMGLMTLARQRLLWWPLHPIGFAVGGTWMMDHAWFSVFVAWLIKVLVLRYAGLGGYRATRWFFLGMFLGYITSGGIWLLVDGLTGLKGGAVLMY